MRRYADYLADRVFPLALCKASLGSLWRNWTHDGVAGVPVVAEWSPGSAWCTVGGSLPPPLGTHSGDDAGGRVTSPGQVLQSSTIFTNVTVIGNTFIAPVRRAPCCSMPTCAIAHHPTTAVASSGVVAFERRDRLPRTLSLSLSLLVLALATRTSDPRSHVGRIHHHPLFHSFPGQVYSQRLVARTSYALVESVHTPGECGRGRCFG